MERSRLGIDTARGGMRLFAKLRPFFLGLIFGEFTCATMWTLLAIFFDVPVPAFPWP